MATIFIIIVFLVILVCIVLAIIVGIFMHTNNGLNSGEPEQAGEMLDDTAQIHNITGPLPPFMLNPTQPLSEIYYHDEQTPNTQPEPRSEPLPIQPQPPAPPPSHMPPPGPLPTGPLPIYHNNQ